MKYLQGLLPLLILLATGFYLWLKPAAFTNACLSTNAGIVICAASDMARISRYGNIPLEHPDFDLSQGPIRLVAARNETVAFQLILRTLSLPIETRPIVRINPWQSRTANRRSKISTRQFVAHYHWVDKGGYSWGPKTAVLEWPAAYPDALIPQQHQCGSNTRYLFESIEMPEAKHANQAVWIDSFIPANTPTGKYTQTLTVSVGDTAIDIPIELQVNDAILPDKPSLHAIGEVYRTYRLEGAGVDSGTTAWKNMAHCYQQLAHKHRMVFIERTPETPTTELDWQRYDTVYNPLLTGDLFTAERGYTGPGTNQPVGVWRTPWPQKFDVQVSAALKNSEISHLESLAKTWSDLVNQKGWTNTEYFAYIFDEVDGPTKKHDPNRAATIARVHNDMQRVQQALDTGSPTPAIDLLWTSHSNPASWTNDPALDLTGKIRLWSPNASAADTDFLRKRIAAGDKAWFYHSGHPAVGAHSINASGIDMRTWGVIAARYGFQGQFMWAVNLGNDDKPFAEPSYKSADDRFGNGVMVYPGNQLNRIGYSKAPGPVPSMRLKAWRRGLQDAELYYLAMQKNPTAANELITQIVPAALTEAHGKARWAQDAASWIEFHKSLLKIASQ